ncbi:hypothetical protein FVEG_14963 [Fusarium verticillioides 7600]|uniref:Uncharacterized protein n=1 Tax=Gibberella moniliformis (strain M3125 / FGSC 7600) TaxID=334819 RepID=W7M1Z8_GIBM7|nr:hypothetical protein FVEG_14963 [Fusarium verticillioides 7600]EWG38912.1 hypothetical protein FVEG_14963 [Fusarium verticillioides 7600]
MELTNICCSSFHYIHFVVVVVDSLSHAVIRLLLLVALSNIPALLDALALASAGGSVLETLAMLVLALGEASGLVSAVDTVRLELTSGLPTPWAMLWSAASKGPLSEEPSPLRGIVMSGGVEVLEVSLRLGCG